MEVQHRPQYLVIMLRKLAGGGKEGESILYITAYDPRTAKEYTCKDINQKPFSWTLTTPKEKKEEDDISRIKAISTELSQLIKERKIILDSVVTPRVLVKVREKGNAYLINHHDQHHPAD